MGKVLNWKTQSELKKKPAVVKTAVEFSEVSTTHGIYYVFERKFGKLSQLFWFLVCAGLIAIAVILILNAYRGWKKNPVITSVKTTGLPVRDLQFPAITICGLGMVDNVLENAIKQQAIDYIRAKKAPKQVKINEDNFLSEILAAHNIKREELYNDLFPGLPDHHDAQDIISSLASSKPDAYLFSKLASEGTVF